MAAKPKTPAKQPEALIDKLESAIGDLLDEVTSVSTDAVKYSITDKMKVFDRALKLEAIKQKMDVTEESSGFDDDN